MARRRCSDRDEPDFDDFCDPEDWAFIGDERIWVAGHTPNGVPFGVPEAEMRRLWQEDHAGAGWARAKGVLHDLFVLWAGPGAQVEVGRTRMMGEGLSRDLWGARVEVTWPDGSRKEGAFAVGMPRRDHDPELDHRTRRELRVLGALGGLALSLRAPAVIGALPEAGHLCLVREWLDGVPLDPRAGRQPSVRPWQVTGEVAAAIHRIDTARFRWLPGSATRRAHAESALAAAFTGLSEPEAQDALAWAREHLPPETPAALLHGDLLGQNLLLHPSEPTAVIDWEYAALGDPAHDLAIVTRGVRQPFQIAGGLDRLIDAYRAAGGHDVAVAEVRLHELCLAAEWYRAALIGGGSERPPEALARLRRVLSLASS